MNIVTATTAWPSLSAGTTPSPASTGATTAGPATDASATSVAAPVATPVQGHHHRHHEHHDEGDEHHGHHDQQAYMALQIKVEQTFSALTSPGANATAANPNASAPAADDDSDEDGGSFEATLKAKFSLSQEGMSASLSIRMSSEGQAGSGDLAAQMQGFVQTLYAALHTLFGGNAANPNATLGTPVSTGAAAALAGNADAAAAPAAADAAASAPAAAANPAATAAAPADAGTPTAAGTPAAAPANASGSLSIKLRLTYNSFGSQLGSLTQQLAQPGAAQAAPGMADLLGDLSTRFGQLLSASPAGSGSGLSLGDFLSALAQSFSSGSTGQAPANDASAVAPATPDATATAPTTPEPASTPALAAYGQVLSFSASLRSQWQLAA